MVSVAECGAADPSSVGRGHCGSIRPATGRGTYRRHNAENSKVRKKFDFGSFVKYEFELSRFVKYEKCRAQKEEYEKTTEKYDQT